MLDCGMSFAADLDLHSRYAYTCSKELTLANMTAWAKVKGIDLLYTADFTHPAWLSGLEDDLTQVGDSDLELTASGLYWGANLAASTNRETVPVGCICWYLLLDLRPFPACATCWRSWVPS